MEPRAFQLFFSLLAFAANAGALVALVTLLAGRRTAVLAPVRELFASAGAWLAWTVAAVCTGGSLYFSEVAHYIPCRLCWIQRGFMYPLAAFLLVYALRPRRALRWFCIAVAVGGGLVSSYHYLIERYPNLESDGVCSMSTPCTAPWFEQFGFVTIAYMALAGFSFIVLSLLLHDPTREAATEQDPDNDPAGAATISEEVA